MKKFHIFDLDGTLVDSMPYWSRKVLRILEMGGIAYGDDLIKTITPLGDRATAAYFQSLGAPYTVDEMFAMMDDYALEMYSRVITTKPFVKEYLDLLRAQGCQLYVLTASPHKMSDVCLINNGIADSFTEIWSIDDFDDVKSNPGIYRKAAARIGCDVQDIVFYDDNLVALQAAKNAGLTCIGVHDSFSDEYVDEIQAFSDQYICSFSQLLPSNCTVAQ